MEQNKTNGWRDVHYIVSIGKDGMMLYCDSWKKVILWLNSKLNENFVCGDDIRYYNECCDERKKITIAHHLFKKGDAKKFYAERRKYITAVRMALDFMEKVQRASTDKRRERCWESFFRHYEYANLLVEKSKKEIWMGEI